MKKIISLASPLLIILTLLISAVTFSSLAQAQNIGSLRVVVPTDFSFKKDLLLGDTDPDVLELQKLLNADVDTVIAVTGPGSAGKESTYFGPLTKTAVIKFQNKYRDVVLTPAGLTAGTGYVGKLTRTKLNLLIGVMNTYDSVGLPQSRAGAGTAAYVQPVTTTPNTGSSMTICQFVELLINIGAVVPAKANQARSALSCATVSTGGSTAGGSTSGNNLVPSADLKINGINGPISISSATDVTISWTSSNVTSCRSLTNTKPLSGSEAVHVTGSGIFAITCTGPYGTVTDSATVNMTTTNSDLSISCQADPNNLAVNNSVTWKTTVTGGNGSYTYDWSGDVTGSTKNVTRQYTTTGIKNGIVKVKSGNLTASASCLALVNAVSNVVVPSSLQVSCSGAPAIGGLSAVWTATASGGSSGYTYSWSGDATGSSNPSSKSYTTAGTKTATVNVTSGSGSQVGTANCSTVVSSASVDPSTLQISCTANPNPATVGSTIIWTAFPLGGTGTYSYVWGGNSANHNPSLSTVASTAGTASNSVTVTSGTQTATANCTATVNAGTSQALQVSCVADPYSVAVGDATTWVAKASGGTGSYTYRWSGTNVLSGSTPSVSKTYATVGTKMATVIVNSGSSAQATASCTTMIAATDEEAKDYCNGRSPKPDVASSTDDGTSEEDSFGWFGGLVTEVGECEIAPEVFVPFFAITKCGDSVSQMSGSMDAYAINYMGSVSQGQTVLGNAMPGITCMDRTDIPIGLVTQVEAGAMGCGEEDADTSTLDIILDILGGSSGTDSLISW